MVIKRQAFVTVTVHDKWGIGVSGVQVTRTWNIGKTLSGMSGSDGTVVFNTGQIKTGKPIAFTVTNAILEN